MSDERIESALRAGMARTRLAVREPIDDAALGRLVARLDGERELAEALAPHAARLGLEGLIADWDGEAFVVRPALVAWARRHRPTGVMLRLALLQPDTKARGATLLELRACAAAEPSPHSGWLRREGALVRVPQPLARAVALGVFGDVGAHADAVCAWGAELVEAADWCARQDALLSLQRHARAFRDLARRASGVARQRALAASGVGATSSEERLELLRHASLELARCPNASDLALVVAEIARREGQHALRGEALRTVGRRPKHHARGLVIEGRARFNQSDFEGASRVYRQALRCADPDDPGAKACALLGIAWNERERGREDRARDAARAAEEKFLALGGDLGLAQVRIHEALLALAHGDGRGPIETLGPLLPSLREPLMRANVHSFLALAHELTGDVDAALAALRICLESAGPGLFQSLWTVYRGRLWLLCGEHERALRDLEEASQALLACGAGASASTALALAALSRAARSEDKLASALLRRADALAGSDGMRRRIVRTSRAVARACAGLRTSPGVAAPDTRAHVTAACRLCRATTGPESLHLRCATLAAGRVLERALADNARHERLVMDEVTRIVRFRGTSQDLSRRPLLWTVLCELARGRGARDDRALVAHVWAGEAILPTAAQNRLRVAVHELRALGLSDAIGRSGGRYVLRAEVESSGRQPPPRIEP